MSRYGTATYGTSTYGSGLSGVFDAAPMWATLIGQGTGLVRVSWTIPDGDYTRLVVVRGKYGIPDNPDREASKRLIDIDYSSGSTDPNVTLSFIFDNNNDYGSEVFYAVYVWGADSDASGGYRWFLAGSTGLVIPARHSSAYDFRGLLPAAFFSPTGGFVEGPEDATSTLYQVAEAIGLSVDAMRTDLDRLLNIYDADRCPARLVRSMGAHLGLLGDTTLPTKAQRNLNKNAVSIFTQKGSVDAIRLMTEALSGMDSYVSMHYNQMPSPFFSGFEQSADDVISGTLTGSPTVTSSMLHTCTVSGTPGYPVGAASDPVRLDASARLGVLTNGSGKKQHVLLLERKAVGSGTSQWDYVPAVKGTGSGASFGSGSTLTVNINGTGWTVNPGYVAEIENESVGPSGPPYDVVTETEALFTPLMDWRLRATAVDAAADEVTIQFAPHHNVLYAEGYTDDWTLIITEHENTFQVGDIVNPTIADLGLDGEDYTVVGVIDPHRFTISHQNGSFSALVPDSVVGNIVTGRDYGRVIKTVPAESYVVSCWVRSDVAAIASISATTHDADLAVDTTTTVPETLVPNTWTQLSATFTTGEYVSLAISATGVTADHFLLVDNVMLAKESDPSKYIDGGNILVQLASSITSDPNGVLRLRLKERLLEVTGSARTHTVMLVVDKYLDLAANKSMVLPYTPMKRFFDQAEPDTVAAISQNIESLTNSEDVTYVPGYDPETAFRVSGVDTLEVLIRGDLVLSTSPATFQRVASQWSELDPTTLLWKIEVRRPTETTLEVKATLGNESRVLTGTVPYAADTSRWYRLRAVADTTDTFADGATITLSHAADSLSEPAEWTVLDTESAAFTLDVPGQIRIGDTTSGTTMRLYTARVSQIASFDGNDFDTLTNTAINPLGAYESTTWTYTP